MKLTGKKVAILATDGFEQEELISPMNALKHEGAEVHVISYKSDKIRGWHGENWGDSVQVDRTVNQVTADEYNALVIPGGVANPDALRQDERSVHFVRDFFKTGKPVASICHGPQMLIEADVVKGRKVTSYPSIKKDLMNAGAQWMDESVVVDSGLVTSRRPSDLSDFNDKLIEEVAEGKHHEQMQSV